MDLSDFLADATTFSMLSAARKPDTFCCDTHEQEVSKWADSSRIFTNWLIIQEPSYKPELDSAEREANTILLEHLATGVQQRALRLYSLLVSYITGRSARLLQSVRDGNGYEAWRRLHEVLSPNTRQRSLALLQAICQLNACKRPIDTLTQLEHLAQEYERVAGREVPEDILISTLVRTSPPNVRTYLSLQLTPLVTFNQLKELLTSFAMASVPAFVSGGNSDMEVDRVKGKGKGKGKDDHKGKGKGTGKDDHFNKGKGYSKGKGKGEDGGKGKSKHKGGCKLQCNKPG